MARCYTLSEAQSRAWEEGSWPSIAVEHDVMEWAVWVAAHESVVVVTNEFQIAFVLSALGGRA
jgi:hypothetical protein